MGAVDLRGPRGTELRAVLQQPKRLALLCYLAVARPRGLHRRDPLLALFWPELDQDHARAALRRALYFLRQAVGQEVLIGRGDDEVGLEPSLLSCDVRDFDRAVAAGDHEQALAL
jgi:serine/threonine-protein kinase